MKQSRTAQASFLLYFLLGILPMVGIQRMVAQKCSGLIVNGVPWYDQNH